MEGQSGALGERALAWSKLALAGARDELADYVAADFQRMGPAKDAANWQQFLSLLDTASTGLPGNPRRIDEAGNLVFVEHDEPVAADGGTRNLATVTVFEFDADGRIRRLDTFQ